MGKAVATAPVKIRERHPIALSAEKILTINIHDIKKLICVAKSESIVDSCIQLECLSLKWMGLLYSKAECLHFGL